MRAMAVMYHDDFDGCASAAVLAGYFHQHGVRQLRFVPVNYDLKTAWSAGKFPLPLESGERLAVVDFLFHPAAECWFDHHPTTFLTPAYAAEYAERPRQMWHHDPRQPSCAQQIYHYLWALQPTLDRYYELVEAANMIDQAAYASPEAVFAMEDPAIAINGVYRQLTEGERSELIRRFMGANGLKSARTMVNAYVEREKQTQSMVLAEYQQRMENRGSVIGLDLMGTGIPFLRYAHFMYYPNSQYAVSLYEYGSVTAISLGRNPWNPGPLKMHEIASRFGGGGHEYAAGVGFPNAMQTTPRQAFRQILEALSQ